MNLEEWSYAATILMAAPVVSGGLYWLFVERPHQRLLEEEENRLERENNYSHLQSEFRKAQFWLADHPEVNQHDRMFGEEEKVTASQQLIFYSTLMSLLEESFILFHKPDDPEYVRMWNTWDDYMNEVLAWPNFRASLSKLLDGEDPEFRKYFEIKAKKLYPDYGAPAPAPESL